MLHSFEIASGCTAPEDLGKYKGYENPTSRGEQKHWDELGLCKCADLVVPVGPKLMRAYFSYGEPQELDLNRKVY